MDDTIDQLLESAQLSDLFNWSQKNDKECNSGLSWKNKLSTENQNNLNDLHELCNGKMPVEVF